MERNHYQGNLQIKKLIGDLVTILECDSMTEKHDSMQEVIALEQSLNVYILSSGSWKRDSTS